MLITRYHKRRFCRSIYAHFCLAMAKITETRSNIQVFRYISQNIEPIIYVEQERTFYM